MSRKPKLIVTIGVQSPFYSGGDRFAHFTMAIRPCDAYKPGEYVAKELESWHANAESSQNLLRECRDADTEWVADASGDALRLRWQTSLSFPDTWYGFGVEDMPAQQWACKLLSKLIALDSDAPSAIAAYLDEQGAAIATTADRYRLWKVARYAPSIVDSLPAPVFAAEPATA